MRLDPTLQIYKQIAAKYNKIYYHSRFWLPEYRMFTRLVQGKKVLDIGCGTGRDTSWFLRDRFDYIGVDGSSAMLVHARARYPRARFLLKDFYHMNFSPESFDGFWAVASLLHIPKWRIGKVLRSIHILLKRGGVGFISLKRKTNLDEGRVTQKKYGGIIGRFFAFYTKTEFQRILAGQGFKIVSSHTKLEDNGTWWLCYFVRKV